MTTVKITAANPAFNGISAGVQFAGGEATIEVPRQQAALEYFARHRFGISEEVPAPKGEDADLAVPAVPNPQSGALDEDLSKLTREELDALAEGRGIDVSGAKKKDDVVALLNANPIVVSEGQPFKGAGDGPVGAQHNQGHDGANPDGDEPQTTPADAGI